MIYNKIRGGLQLGVTAPPPPPPKKNPAKFASQGDAYMRTDAQIKFLYYPLLKVIKNDVTDLSGPPAELYNYLVIAIMPARIDLFIYHHPKRFSVLGHVSKSYLNWSNG